MNDVPADVIRAYAGAIAHVFAQSAGITAENVDIQSLADFFEDRFRREASRLPPEGRDELLSAVALELLERMGRTERQGGSSLPQLEDSFRRATRTVLDTIRHRIARARLRERGLQDARARQPAANDPNLEGLLRRELAATLSPGEMTVLYLVTEGLPVDAIAKRMDISRRTVYRALGAIRASLEASRLDDGR